MLALLDLIGIADAAGHPVRELPEGTRKLLDVAVALALQPKLLLMDEPTSGVSSGEKFAIMDALVRAMAERRVTSVFVEHDMEMVTRYADRVAVWNMGRIEAQAPGRAHVREPHAAGALEDPAGPGTTHQLRHLCNLRRRNVVNAVDSSSRAWCDACTRVADSGHDPFEGTP